jgi:hypothetical protein
VFASLVGISIGLATRWATLAGSSWNNYATRVVARWVIGS